MYPSPRIVACCWPSAVDMGKVWTTAHVQKTCTTHRTIQVSLLTVAGAKKGSFLSAAWFIAMMAAIALLLLILIVVCIVKRNRGKEYRCECV